MIKLNFRRGSAFASKKAKKYLETINPEDVKTITIIRHAAIGDFMNIRPFLINAREYFPNANITLSVLRTAMYGIPHDLIDDLHIMDKDDPKDKTKKTSILTRIKQARELSPQDIIFDLTDSSLTILLIIFSKAKLKIGYPYRWIRRIPYDITTLRSDFVVEAESTQHMLNILGSQNLTPLKYGFENIYSKKNIQNRIIYFPGASINIKCWEENKFITLIDKLSNEYPSYEHIILQGIREDEKFINIYESLQNRRNVKLQTTMNLDDTMNFLSNSILLVSNDTGIRNMAIATETSTVGIFFATIPFRYWPRDGKHECVFTIDYKSPSADMVFKITKNLINKMN